MNRDDIIQMGMEAHLCGLDPCPGYINDLERFAALVAAREREECAKLCETMITQIGKVTRLYDSPTAIGCENGLTNAAAAIRARETKWMNT
jgi:hypothetical protein